MSYSKISIFDTSIGTKNVGDEIIMDAAIKEIHSIFSSSQFFRLPTHDIIGINGISLLRHSDLAIVGGSNILSSYMNRYRQWKLNLVQTLLIPNRIVLMGVGWRDYQDKSNFYTRNFLRRVLSPTYMHSVRDSYTEAHLREIGIENVLNTSCPTMWQLTEEHNNKIPSKKADSVVFTLTDYNKDERYDSMLIEILKQNYDRLFFWVQSIKDFAYFNSLKASLIEDVVVIPPNLKSYDLFLFNNDCDYIGTRLHGGIRALQALKRTIIIGIDNRANEKKKDFNINVVERENIAELDRVINSVWKTRITLPQSNINRWKMQFQ